jgi:hypothetical protein
VLITKRNLVLGYVQVRRTRSSLEPDLPRIIIFEFFWKNREPDGPPDNLKVLANKTNPETGMGGSFKFIKKIKNKK